MLGMRLIKSATGHHLSSLKHDSNLSRDHNFISVTENFHAESLFFLLFLLQSQRERCLVNRRKRIF